MPTGASSPRPLSGLRTRTEWSSRTSDAWRGPVYPRLSRTGTGSPGTPSCGTRRRSIRHTTGIPARSSSVAGPRWPPTGSGSLSSSPRPARSQEAGRPGKDRNVPIELGAPRTEARPDSSSVPAVGQAGSGLPPLLKRASAEPRLSGGTRAEALNLRAWRRNAGTCRRARLRGSHSNGSVP